MSYTIGSAQSNISALTQVMTAKVLRTTSLAVPSTHLCMSWKRHEDGTGETSQSHSFLYDHQIEDHNGVPPKFKLQSKRYYESKFGIW